MPDTQPSELATGLHSQQPSTCLKGVGPKLAAKLSAAGIDSIGDLLRFFPRRHETVVELDRPDPSRLGVLVRLSGRVDSCRLIWLPKRRNMLRVDFVCAGGERFAAAFFNQPYLRKNFEVGNLRQLEGVLARRGADWSLKGVRVLPRGYQSVGPCRLRYPEVLGISEMRLRSLMQQALDRADLESVVAGRLPASLLGEFGLDGQALRAMHAPGSLAEHERARLRFALLEAVELFRRVEAIVRKRAASPGPRVIVDVAAAEVRLARILPFELTSEQAAAVRNLRGLLARPSAMAVLLQGDVGTGKTAVALAAALDTVSAGFQVAFLAPTELLAEQHHAVVREWFEGEQVRIELLTGSLTSMERRRIEADLLSGTVQLLFGTHALISQNTIFSNLGLVIIDEQHRFGVTQRNALVRKGRNPHLIVMTATPIPRTLTLTLFGDMQPLYLRERPLGRRAVRTSLVERKRWPRVLRSIERCIRRSGQVYVVCAKIGEDGEKGGAVRMQRELAKRFDVKLIHGRMPAAQRQEVTEAFRRGDFPVLVGTTVLEVGIDVPGAQLMVIVGAERFGLATLHQLRGRVGRGSRRGLCILTGEITARSRAICRSNDGFELAEEDLRSRGAGELLGRAQSGALDFRALDPVEDLELLQRARQAVRESTEPGSGCALLQS